MVIILSTLLTAGNEVAAATLDVSQTMTNWETVDDFGLATGNAEAHGVATDAAGGIYVVGTASGHGIVRYSADGGSNWITRDDFVYDSAGNNVFNAVTVDYQGAVFVGGTGGGHWIVRRSTDQGVTWETVDDYWRPRTPPEEPGTNGVVYSLSSDRQGRVYGAGPLIKTGCPCYNTWWVRGSSIEGTNWDTKLALPSGYGGIRQATCAGEDVYATGAADGDPSIGLILRSSDHGATWTPVFRAVDDIHNAITADPAGNLYTAGYSVTSTSIVWLVRQAAPGGTNWSTVDRSSYEPWLNGTPRPDGHYAYATSIAVDAAGNVCVTGKFIENSVTYSQNGTTYSANESWFTRQYLAAAGQWSTTDVFSYSTNKHGIALGAAIAPSGSVFTVGYGTSDSGQRRWVVRKRADRRPTPPPTANFTADPTSGNPPLTVQFTDQSTGSITSWNWDFGDGSVPSADLNPSHTYSNAGNYTVTLIVTGPGGSDANSLVIAVTALTAQQQAQSLATMVDEPIRQGALNRGDGQRLNAKVSGAMRSMNHGDTVNACRQMAAFISDVQDYLRRGALTQAQGQALTDAANELRAAIGCQ